MNIQLNQHEIEAAIRESIARQGVHLRNKTIGIAFSAGRGSNGLSANLTIDDIRIPGDDDVGTAITAQESVGSMPALPKAVAGKADPVILPGAGEVKQAVMSASDVATASVKIGNGTLAEAAEALVLPTDLVKPAVATASLATPETEAAKAEPVAEAQVAASPIFAAAEAKVAEAALQAEEPVVATKTASLFGSNANAAS